MINSSPVKGVHKFTSPITADHDLELKLLWAADKDRPAIYSRESFRRFWDERYLVQEHSR